MWNGIFNFFMYIGHTVEKQIQIQFDYYEMYSGKGLQKTESDAWLNL